MEKIECTCTLIRSDQLNSIFVEPHIETNYRRPGMSVCDTLKTMCSYHNEIANVYTHLIPAIYFVIYLGVIYVTQRNILTAPLVIYWISVICFLFGSSFAHQFKSISIIMWDVCYFIDYMFISLYIYGCSVAYFAYGIPNSWRTTVYPTLYLPTSFILAALSTVLTGFTLLFSPKNSFMNNSGRLFVYPIPMIFVILPVIDRIVIDNPSDASLETICVIFIGIAIFFYGSHLPERCTTGGVFDVFNSHTIFHICIVISAHFQLWAFMHDARTHKQLRWTECTGFGASLIKYEDKILWASFLTQFILNALLVVALWRVLRLMPYSKEQFYSQSAACEKCSLVTPNLNK